MESGCGFGELALLYNDKRSATIEASTSCECYSLDGTLFKQIVMKASMDKRNTRQRFLNSIKLFDSIDKYQKLKLIDGLTPLTLKNGEFVFYEGDHGDAFYIIEEGEVQCLKMIEDYKFKCVRVLGKEDHFGEIALINDAKRSLGIRVHSESCKLLKLDRKTFTRILGEISKHLKMDYGQNPPPPKEEEKKEKDPFALLDDDFDKK